MMVFFTIFFNKQIDYLLSIPWVTIAKEDAANMCSRLLLDICYGVGMA